MEPEGMGGKSAYVHLVIVMYNRKAHEKAPCSEQELPGYHPPPLFLVNNVTFIAANET